MSRPAKLHKNWLRWRPCPGWTGRTGFLGEEPHPGPTHHVVLLGGRVVFPEPAEGVLYVPLDHLPAVGGGTPASRGRENSLSHMWGCPTLSPQPRPAASWHWQPWVCLCLGSGLLLPPGAMPVPSVGTGAHNLPSDHVSVPCGHHIDTRESQTWIQ